MNIILKYFPALSAPQQAQFAALNTLYAEWNKKINIVSRKDIENLYERHVLHSLGIARMIGFKANTAVMDVGTGGGFPGIPLAILFPDTHFHLVDRIGKKIRVVDEVSAAIGLQNISSRHCGVEEEKKTFDFVVSRAVMPLPDLYNLVKKNIRKESFNALPNGIICLKGGDLTGEIKPFRNKAEQIALSNFFDEPFFETKKVVYLSV